MTFIFWQNMLSIHQSAFFKALATRASVIVVVEQEIDERRKKHGWKIPDYGKSEIVVSPGLDKLNYLLSIKNAVHTFSGVGSYKLIHWVFKEAINRRLRVGIMSESFNTNGVKGRVRLLKHFFLLKRYGKNVNFVLAIGNKAKSYFKFLRYPSYNTYDWGYFTEMKDMPLEEEYNEGGKPKLIFIGSIDERKNILNLVKACLEIENLYESFTIIGGGEKNEELLQLIKNKRKIKFLGQISNDEVYLHLRNSDLCILPSLFDGWGAVVNESLMVGVPVIASTNCGASILLDGKVRGNTFSIEADNLLEVLNEWLNKGKVSSKVKRDISSWSRERVSGSAAAKYFVNVMEYKFLNKSRRPYAPWLID